MDKDQMLSMIEGLGPEALAKLASGLSSGNPAFGDGELPEQKGGEVVQEPPIPPEVSNYFIAAQIINDYQENLAQLRSRIYKAGLLGESIAMSALFSKLPDDVADNASKYIVEWAEDVCLDAYRNPVILDWIRGQIPEDQLVEVSDSVLEMAKSYRALIEKVDVEE